MALVADPIVPAPSPTSGGGGANAQVLQDFANQRAGAVPQVSSDPSNIPLWLVRPANANMSPAPEPGVQRMGRGDFAQHYQPQTKSFAEQYWLDMPDEDKKAFAQAAMSADMWKPTDGAYGLAQAWTQAVDLAQQYNTAHSDQSKWLSPFEAIQKLAPDVAASKNAVYNGFSETTKVQQFRESDLYSQAKSILQNDLGRDPTKEELHAFTVAVNAAAKKNPEVVTTQQANPDGSGQNQQVVYGGQFDPTQTIDQMVRNTDEYAQYQAAVDYFPAVMQALGAVV